MKKFGGFIFLVCLVLVFSMGGVLGIDACTGPDGMCGTPSGWSCVDTHETSNNQDSVFAGSLVGAVQSFVDPTVPSGVTQKLAGTYQGSGSDFCLAYADDTYPYVYEYYCYDAGYFTYLKVDCPIVSQIDGYSAEQTKCIAAAGFGAYCYDWCRDSDMESPSDVLTYIEDYTGDQIYEPGYITEGYHDSVRVYDECSTDTSINEYGCQVNSRDAIDLGPFSTEYKRTGCPYKCESRIASDGEDSAACCARGLWGNTVWNDDCDGSLETGTRACERYDPLSLGNICADQCTGGAVVTRDCSNCGNSVIDAGEACDSTAIPIFEDYGNGIGECEDYSASYSSGDLGCTSCAIDTSGCVVGPTCGDATCSAGENCPVDVSSCGGDLKCQTRTCTNGCEVVNVGNGVEDELCSGSTGCTGGDCVCDGSGSCVSRPPCTLTGSWWNPYSVIPDGNNAEMVVIGSSSCAGKNIEFKIYERDTYSFDDLAATIQGTFADGGDWTAVQHEVDGGGPDYSYYFVATLTDGSGTSITSTNDLIVFKCGDGACLYETCGSCSADCGACPTCTDGTYDCNTGVLCQTWTETCSGGEWNPTNPACRWFSNDPEGTSCSSGFCNAAGSCVVCVEGVDETFCNSLDDPTFVEDYCNSTDGDHWRRTGKDSSCEVNVCGVDYTTEEKIDICDDGCSDAGGVVTCDACSDTNSNVTVCGSAECGFVDDSCGVSRTCVDNCAGDESCGVGNICVEASLVSWRNTTGGDIGQAQVGDTVLMFYDKDFDSGYTFDIWEEEGALVSDKEIAMGIESFNLSGKTGANWTIVIADFLDVVDDMENFIFVVDGETSGYLNISEDYDDSPMDINVVLPVCGSNFTYGENVTIRIEASDGDDFIEGNVSFENEFVTFGEGGLEISHNFSSPGNYQIYATATNSRGKTWGDSTSIMVVGSSPADYVAACIDEPSDLKIISNPADFDAGSSRGLSCISGVCDEVVVDDLMFSWFFMGSDEEDDFSRRGNEPESYIFTKKFVGSGVTSVRLEVKIA